MIYAMITATKRLLQEIDALAARRKEEILNSKDALKIEGTTYYVSNDGDDANDGLSPEKAWKTLERVSDARLCEGDGVLFRRGDLFRGRVLTQEGVSYGAFGEGEKPKIYAWDEDLADPELWELADAEHHIWKYKKKILDAGTLVFNDGERHSYKHIPSYLGGRFVCRDTPDVPFVMSEQMTGDLDIYWHYEDTFNTKPSNGEDFPIPEVENTYGDLYLRCNAGNPGGTFRTIEATPRRVIFSVNKNHNVKIDNICMKYAGIHAVAAGWGGVKLKGLHVTNCEIGWVGGTIQGYQGTDPNYPEGGRGTVTRYGNGVEIYGGCDDYEVSNCYVYEMYDAGLTHQVSTFGKTVEMENVRYFDNLIEKCVYSIEYFLDINDNGDGRKSFMNNIEMKGNILRQSGYGWGQQRHNKHTPAHIKGWSYVNTASNYKIHDNIFDRAAFRMLHLVAEKAESMPKMYNNTYIQYAGNMIGSYGANECGEPDVLRFDENADATIANVLRDKDAKIYVIK